MVAGADYPVSVDRPAIGRDSVYRRGSAAGGPVARHDPALTLSGVGLAFKTGAVAPIRGRLVGFAPLLTGRARVGSYEAIPAAPTLTVIPAARLSGSGVRPPHVMADRSRAPDPAREGEGG